MKKDLIYISGAITKNPHFVRDFARGERKMRRAGFDVINPAKLIAVVPLPDHSDYMDISLAWLSKASAIYMLCGWSTSEGANMEINFARDNGIPIHYEDGAERKGEI